MQLDCQRTIVAVSSPLVPALRAIVRISGSQTRSILMGLIHATTGEQHNAKTALLDTRVPRCAELLCDVGLAGRLAPLTVYFWPNARSFTGEPSAELHVLGALPIVESLTERVASLGAVPAGRGEFTLRSFLAGKIDLTQAEAVLGVIEADSDEQLQQALGQLGGNISTPVRKLRDQLLELIAHLEAGLDFVEEDIEFISSVELQVQLRKISGQLTAIADQLASRGTRNRLPQVVLVGLPNAGKSSLFNALLGEARTIVSPQAGTTRDAISATAHIGEQAVELIDTAGLEELQEATPRGLAQHVLQERLTTADVILFCLDRSCSTDSDWFERELARLGQFGVPLIVVETKQDLLQPGELRKMTWAPAKVAITLRRDDSQATQPSYFSADPGIPCLSPTDSECGPAMNSVGVSLQDPESLARLRGKLQDVIQSSSGNTHSDALHRTMMRCRQCLDLAIDAIHRALDVAENDGGEELVAVELRIALDDLSSVIGEVHTEDILGQIFSRFCIGK